MRPFLPACILLACAALGCHPRAAVPEASATVPEASSTAGRCPPPPATGDHQHDFDFEFGRWTAKLSRRLRPLTGSNEWVAYEGTSVVHPLWQGRANVGELDVTGPAGRIEGLTLRLYDPASRRWTVRFASSRDGELTPGLVGGFSNGRGEFLDQETLDGKPICARFIFSEMTKDTFRFEQAFSPDEGKTWEVNWVATFKRVAP
ncbi:MAG TPA: hypothetical protein VFN45_18455 [Myxococcaceae bacterium]|nr:hypothetical protein [Myxococcaceae bacterium]